jgi:Sulfotransferase family
MKLFIVGAAKSGTTVLWSWLRSHPDVFFPDFKEPHYFSFQNGRRVGGPEMDPHYKNKITTTLEAYQSLYQNCKHGQILGDASPGYLYHEHAAEIIKSYDPDAKIICVLRNPVDRAFSQFLHHVRDGLEQTSNFSEALNLEEARIRNGWWWGFHYAKAGNYFGQWTKYCEFFKPHQRLLIFFDDLEKHPEKVYLQICQFLEISPQNDMKFDLRVNDTSQIKLVPKYGRLYRMLEHGSYFSHLMHQLFPLRTTKWVRRCLMSLNQVKKPTLSPEVRQRLYIYYKEDIEKLSEFVGTNLSHWM